MIVKEFTWRALSSAIPLFCIPAILLLVEDALTSSVMLSIATGSSTLILAVQDVLHYRVKGEHLLPRLSMPLITAGALAMLAQVMLFSQGVRGWYYIVLQAIVMIMFIHSAVREWKRWI